MFSSFSISIKSEMMAVIALIANYWDDMGVRPLDLKIFKHDTFDVAGVRVCNSKDNMNRLKLEAKQHYKRQ